MKEVENGGVDGVDDGSIDRIDIDGGGENRNFDFHFDLVLIDYHNRIIYHYARNWNRDLISLQKVYNCGGSPRNRNVYIKFTIMLSNLVTLSI